MTKTKLSSLKKALGFVRSKQFTYFLFLTLTIVIAYSGLITAPVSFSYNDFGNNTTSNAVAIRNFFLYQQLGLWDNTNGLGFPLLSTPSLYLYPFKLIEYFIPDIIVATRYITLLHLILAGSAMFSFLLLLKCPTPAAFLGASTYVINYYVQSTLTAGSLNEIFILLWMSLTVTFLWFALFNANRTYAILSGISLGMHFFSNTSFSLYFTLIIVFLLFVFYVLYSLVKKRRFYKMIKNVVIISFTLLGVAFGLAAVRILPLFEYVRLSVRSHVPLYSHGNPFASGWELSTIPSLFHYITNIIVRDALFTKYTPINMFFLLFVILGVFSRSKKSIFFGAVTFLALWASMGKNALIDVYRLFYIAIPGISTIEHPYRFFTVTNFTFPILASLGASFLYIKFPNLHFKVYRLKVHVVTICIVVILLGSLRFVWGQMHHFFVKENQKVYRIEREDNILNKILSKVTSQDSEIVHVASLYHVPYKEVYHFSGYIYNFRLTNPYYPAFSLNYQFFPLHATIFNKEFEKKYFSLNSDHTFIEKKYKLLGLMNTKYLVTEKGHDDYPNDFLVPILKENDGTIYQLKSYLPFVNEVSTKILLLGNDDFRDFNAFRAKMLLLNGHVDVGKVSFFTSDRNNLRDFSQNELNMFDAVILSDKNMFSESRDLSVIKEYQKQGGIILYLPFQERSYDDLRARNYSLLSSVPAEYLSVADITKFESLIKKLGSKTYDSKSSILLQKDSPEYIGLKINTKVANAAFRLIETYYPGWKLFIDNKEHPLYMADGLIKGFVIPEKGTHEVILVFRPITFYIGVLISLATLLSLSGYFILIYVVYKN